MAATKRDLEVLTCAFCGQQKAWRDGFPSRTFAQCWKCAWDAHDSKHHPKPKPKKRWRRVPVDARGRVVC